MKLHLPSHLVEPGHAEDGAGRPELGRLLGRAAGGGDGDDGRGAHIVGCLHGSDGGGSRGINLGVGDHQLKEKEDFSVTKQKLCLATCKSKTSICRKHYANKKLSKIMLKPVGTVSQPLGI